MNELITAPALPPADGPDCTPWRELVDGFQRLRSDGILEMRHKSGCVQDLASVKAQLSCANQLLGGGNAPLLVVLGRMKSQKPEARRYLTRSSDIPRSLSRAGLVVASPVARVIANAFLGLVRTEIPLQVFTDEQKALLWLSEAVR